jgi:hypothetical protein
VQQVSLLRNLEVPRSNHEPQANCSDNFHTLSHIFEADTEIKHTVTRTSTSYLFVNFIPSFDNRKYTNLNKRYFVRDEVIEGWRKPHNEELHKVNSSRSLIRIIKLRRMRCEGHVARTGRKEGM